MKTPFITCQLRAGLLLLICALPAHAGQISDYQNIPNLQPGDLFIFERPGAPGHNLNYNIDWAQMSGSFVPTNNGTVWNLNVFDSITGINPNTFALNFNVPIDFFFNITAPDAAGANYDMTYQPGTGLATMFMGYGGTTVATLAGGSGLVMLGDTPFTTGSRISLEFSDTTATIVLSNAVGEAVLDKTAGNFTLTGGKFVGSGAGLTSIPLASVPAAGTNQPTIWSPAILPAAGAAYTTVITNTSSGGVVITNPASKTFLIVQTNGLLVMNAGIVAGGVYHTNGITMTNNNGESLNMFWDGSSFWREVPQDWGTGSGLLFESGSRGGFALVSGDGLADIEVRGDGNATVAVGNGATLVAESGFSVVGTSSLDNGSITTDGTGNLTASGFNGSGAGLTGLSYSQLGTIPRSSYTGTDLLTNGYNGTVTLTNLNVRGPANIASVTNNPTAVANVSIFTNGNFAWITYPTNNTMKYFTNLPMGSLCSTTNGQLFTLSNLVWRTSTL